ncbi:MAG: hypothetical protein ACPGJS_07445, partial [Flammeovirgaceae bacterium]
MSKEETILRRSLAQFSKTELIDLLVQQGSTISELRGELKALQSKVEELERAAHRQAAPFRIKVSKLSKEKKSPGRKRGHLGSYRKPSGPIDEYIEVSLPNCPHCQGEVGQVEPIKQVIEDVKVSIHRTALTTYRGHCKSCGKVHSSHPLQVSH